MYTLNAYDPNTYNPLDREDDTDASLFANLHAAEADAAYGLDPSDAGDMPITPRCIVRVLASPATCPLFARVERVYSDGRLEVSDLVVRAVQWKVPVDGVAFHMDAEAWAIKATASTAKAAEAV